MADDLTGAADSALGFVRAGQRVLVRLAPCGEKPPGAHAVIAVDTNTRRLDPQAAKQVVVESFREHATSNQLLYKKIDSTLRGQWAAEVAALQAQVGMAIVAPAHPSMGRVVQEGRVLVHGVQLAETDTWNLEHGHRSAVIRDQLLEMGLLPDYVDADGWLGKPEALSHYLDELARTGTSSVIVDARSIAALRDLARAVLMCRQPMFCAGSGGAGAGTVRP